MTLVLRRRDGDRALQTKLKCSLSCFLPFPCQCSTASDTLASRSMVRVKPHRIGDIVPVRSLPGGYPLPEGLPEGTKVRVIAFDHAYRVVEWQGQEFHVYVMNLDTGLEPVPPTRQ